MAIPTKEQRLAFRVTDQQASIYRSTAEKEGLRLSEWLRRLASRRVAEVARQEAGG